MTATITTIRNRLRKLYARELAAWREHKKQYPNACPSWCEDAQRWWNARTVLKEALKAAGARAPKEDT